jgi:1,4-alpha-glucan branching enzyme
MPGDEWQQRANFRWFRAYMTAHPGKKLTFMGTEFGQWHEWRVEHSIDWHLLQLPAHRALHDFDRELNQLYASRAALHAGDADYAGFAWIDLHSADQSVFAFARRDPREPGRAPMICVFNCTPVPRDGYRLGVADAGAYRKVLDTDAARFGGSGYNRQELIEAEHEPSHGYPYRVPVDLPPLGAIFLELERTN